MKDLLQGKPKKTNRQIVEAIKCRLSQLQQERDFYFKFGATSDAGIRHSELWTLLVWIHAVPNKPRRQSTKQ